jgi:hypothetical protein
MFRGARRTGGKFHNVQTANGGRAFARQKELAMSSPQMEQKSRSELEALSLESAKRQLGCRDLTHVPIRRLYPEGSGPNWEPAKFVPTLPKIADGYARKAIAALTGRYALANE